MQNRKPHQHCCLSAAHYSFTVVVGSSCVRPQCLFRCLHVLEQVLVSRGLGVGAGDFSSVVPPGRGSPRLPLLRLRLFRQLWYQCPPPFVHERHGLWIPGVCDVGEGCGARGVRLLAGYFSGVVAPGSGSPGRPLLSLSLLRQLGHRHALLLVPEEVKRWEGITQMSRYAVHQALQMQVWANTKLPIYPTSHTLSADHVQYSLRAFVLHCLFVLFDTIILACYLTISQRQSCFQWPWLLTD